MLLRSFFTGSTLWFYQKSSLKTSRLHDRSVFYLKFVSQLLWFKCAKFAIPEFNAFVLRIPLLSWHTTVYLVHFSAVPAHEVLYLRWIRGHRTVGKVQILRFSKVSRLKQECQRGVVIKVITFHAVLLRPEKKNAFWKRTRNVHVMVNSEAREV